MFRGLGTTRLVLGFLLSIVAEQHLRPKLHRLRAGALAGDASSDGGSSGAWRVPRLTATQTAALDALDALCADPSMHLEMRLEPGDVQWLHNHSTLHARSAYRRRDGRRWRPAPAPRVGDAAERRDAPARVRRAVRNRGRGAEPRGIGVEGQVPYCALEPEE